MLFFPVLDINNGSNTQTSILDDEAKMLIPTTRIEYFEKDVMSSFDHSLYEKVYPFENSNITSLLIYNSTNVSNTEEEYNIGYYDDNYDIFFKMPISKTISLKANIKSVVKFTPKPIV